MPCPATFEAGPKIDGPTMGIFLNRESFGFVIFEILFDAAVATSEKNPDSWGLGADTVCSFSPPNCEKISFSSCSVGADSPVSLTVLPVVGSVIL
jgi:hypothetical protein